MKKHVIAFDQPAGSFLLAALSGDEIIKISKASPRKADSTGGIQRELDSRRVKEIAEYAHSADASFPTPILLALDQSSYELDDETLTIEGEHIADIVDGQHRVKGLEQSKIAEKFTIPVVFILDATEEQKALIFATINGKQTKVPASLIYDLFDVTTTRSPQKTAHEIARALNSTSSSPWFKRLKMLGKKTPFSNESLSQGTFIKFLLPLISTDPVTDMDNVRKGKELQPRPDCIFNEYWRKDQDSVILKILINVFQAAKETWPDEWDDSSSSILTKTTGYTGIISALPKMFNKGRETKNFSLDFFKSIFEKVKEKMKKEHIELTSQHFISSARGEAQFRKLIESVIP